MFVTNYNFLNEPWNCKELQKSTNCSQMGADYRATFASAGEHAKWSNWFQFSFDVQLFDLIYLAPVLSFFFSV